MKQLFNKTKNKIELATIGAKNWMTNKKNALKADRGDATVLVVIAFVLLSLILLIVFKDAVFEPIKKGCQQLGSQMDEILNITN